MIKKKVMKCYKNKITYWQNRLNKAINCAPCDYSEENIERALSSLTYFVNKQVEVDFPPVQGEMYWAVVEDQVIDEAIAGELF